MLEPARGGTVSRCGSRPRCSNFNSCPCERGDFLWDDLLNYRTRFQFPPLREGRRAGGRPSAPGGKFQFPPLREGRRKLGLCSRTIIISIPAPARGATGARCVKGGESIFQFPPLREGRRAGGGSRGGLRLISIPAPARGATDGPGAAAASSPYFNSRPCERGDVTHHGDVLHNLHFNSRPCERGDERKRRAT